MKTVMSLLGILVVLIMLTVISLTDASNLN
jgi:hypothetical protein